MKHAFAVLVLLLLVMPAAPAGEPVPEPAPAAEPGPAPVPAPKPDGVPMSLAECLVIALRQNVELRQQELSDQRSDLDRSSALADFLPTLTASGELSRSGDVGDASDRGRTGSARLSGKTPWGTTLSAGASQSRDDDDGDVDASSSLSAQLRQPLLYGAGTADAFYGYRSALRARSASREDLTRQAQSTVFSVRQLYWAAVKNGLVVQASRRSLASADYFLKSVQARLKAQQASRLDVSNAEIQRSSREVALTDAETGLEDSLDDLKVVMDLDLGSRLWPASPPVYSPSRRDPEGLLGVILADRSDLRAARERLEVKRLDLARKRRNSWPDLDLVVDYRVSGSGSGTAASQSYETESASVGLELSVPLGMVKRRNDYRKAQSQMESERLDLHRKEVAAEKELRGVLRDLGAAERNLASYQKRVAAAKLAAAAARALYERGRATSFDVIRAEDDLLNAELGLARSQANCLTLQARLDLVIGRPITEVIAEAAATPAKDAGGQGPGAGAQVPGAAEPAPPTPEARHLTPESNRGD